jgi:hypothetical protein
MTERTTKAQLDWKIKLINSIHHTPEAHKPGSYKLDYYPAGGGYKLVQLNENYAERDVITSIRMPATAMYYILEAYISGYEAGERSNR